MIVKSHEISKINILNVNYFLFYGKNDGLKNQVIEENFIINFKGQILKYDENDFINNYEILLSEFFNKSLFETDKLIIISKVTDKIMKFIDEITESNLKDIKIIFKAGVLEKKSKLRSLFEKNKKLISVPFYEDDPRSLSNIVIKFLNLNNIKLSRESINLIINRSSGDRQNLKIELDKILNYSFSKKTIGFEAIKKLTNLSENYSVNELADNYLSKNTANTSRILNENKYSNEDCILIIRTILNKSQRLLDIIEKNQKNKNINEVIASIKPPIFWKDKDNVIIQTKKWGLNDLKNKIYEINELETLIKNNNQNSLNLVSNFIVNY